ncbi:MAG TPA: bifunctional DNA primase/polymerase [Candidatus Dormibacteraeota bacterium]|nr:bifunctional DNA primase/polymerase [Candidatus Dormibacteraeota bacterium]
MLKSNVGSASKVVKPPIALLRAHRRWHAFPIRAAEKAPPCFKNELELASNDPATIDRWTKEFQNCNWGLALNKSGMIVVDVDTKPGKVGQQTLDILELEHGPLPRTLTVRTPSGGSHYYFHETARVKHRMRVSAFGRDVDSTNYVLLPGSLVHGAGYTILDNVPAIAAPDWFAEYLDAPMIGDNEADQAPVVEQDTPDLIAWAIDYLKRDAPPSIQFQNGEFTLLIVAGRLKDHGISEHMAVELLTEHYNGRCEPEWNVGEGPDADRLDVKVANAWLYLKQTAPGAHTAAADFGNDVPDIYETEADRRLMKQRSFTREDRYGMDKPMPWKSRKS